MLERTHVRQAHAMALVASAVDHDAALRRLRRAHLPTRLGWTVESPLPAAVFKNRFASRLVRPSLTIPLSHDRSADIMGVDLTQHGLRCRYGHGCRAHFDPATQSSTVDLAIAGARRNVHEFEAHGYRHVVIVPRAWGYTQKTTSARGRSLLGRK